MKALYRLLANQRAMNGAKRTHEAYKSGAMSLSDAKNDMTGHRIMRNFEQDKSPLKLRKIYGKK